MPYYYLCSYSLSPGSIVQKGNWGRIMNLEKINQNSALNLLRELIFEKVRIEEYINRPSRFGEVMFLCPNLQSAEEFKKESPFGILYEVEPLNTNANSFEADWSLIKNPYNKTINQVEEEAHRYWECLIISDNKKEIIIDSDIRILQKLED